MISKIQEWFKGQLDTADQDSTHTLELATAVLLYEVMRSDNKFEEVERQVYRAQLEKHFDLNNEELESLCALSESYAESAADYQQFTRVLNDCYSAEQKRTVLDSLWSIAYSDHDLSPDEDYTIRKIADLLYIPHNQFIQSKLSVKPN